MAKQIISVSADQLQHLQTINGVVLMNEDKYKVTKTPKGFVWAFTKEEIKGEDRRRSQHTMLFRKLEDAITHFDCSDTRNIQSYSGDIRLPKVIGENHIHNWGINDQGVEVDLSLTLKHLF